MKKHVYVAEQNKGFNFTVEVDVPNKDKAKRVHVRFVDGQFTTDDDALAGAIDALRGINPGIARRCRKADKEAAEKLARAHRALLSRTGAVKGGVTAEATRKAMDIALGERDIALRSQNANSAEFAKENLQLTEKAGIAPKVEVAPKPAIKLGNVLAPKVIAAK